MNQNSNDLFDFMAAATTEMASNYKTIRKRSSEDPGTAGDQGEKDWAKLLKNWLPPMYRVVTKGRIISPQGKPGPQVDILILHPAYPKFLKPKKYYLSRGVLAAFECKTTLRSVHIKSALETSAVYKNLWFRASHFGTPYKDLYTPPIYGLLAHSHEWKEKKSTPLNNVDNLLAKSDREIVKHPKEMIDLICVADLATWVPSKFGIFPCHMPGTSSSKLYTSYMCHSANLEKQTSQFSPIGALISSLIQALAWQDSYIRDIAEYIIDTSLSTASEGIKAREWDIDVFSVPVRKKLMTPLKSHIIENYTGEVWEEWRMSFPLG